MSRHHDVLRGDPRWAPLRAECFERDDWTCVECGSTEQLEADHRKPISLYPELAFDLDNLQTLCSTCNKRKSDDVGEIERLPWLNPRWPELADLVFSGAPAPPLK